MTDYKPSKLPDAVLELVHNLQDARNTLEDVTISAPHITGPDSRACLDAAKTAIAAIDEALDLIKYNE